MATPSQDEVRSSSAERRKIPVYLLKTKSGPTDAYAELFSTGRDGFEFAPVFVPVLEHRILDAGTDQVRSLLRGRGIGRGAGCRYGGLIFTSQRAVEAFAQLVAEGPDEGGWPHLQDIPVYSVGPATTRALKAVGDGKLQVFGEHTGNGDALAQFILEHYGGWYRERETEELPPLLFMVGEQRRDIIPKTLMDETLPAGSRIQVDEVVVYGTGVKESFEDDFRRLLKSHDDDDGSGGMFWAVVFSPAGCDGLLRALGFLDESTGRAKPPPSELRRTGLVATIGPTTKAFLEKSFGFEPDVCSEQPSPEGLWAGITEYITRMT